MENSRGYKLRLSCADNKDRGFFGCATAMLSGSSSSDEMEEILMLGQTLKVCHISMKESLVEALANVQ